MRGGGVAQGWVARGQVGMVTRDTGMGWHGDRMAREWDITGMGRCGDRTSQGWCGTGMAHPRDEMAWGWVGTGMGWHRDRMVWGRGGTGTAWCRSGPWRRQPHGVVPACPRHWELSLGRAEKPEPPDFSRSSSSASSFGSTTEEPSEPGRVLGCWEGDVGCWGGWWEQHPFDTPPRTLRRAARPRGPTVTPSPTPPGQMTPPVSPQVAHHWGIRPLRGWVPPPHWCSCPPLFPQVTVPLTPLAPRSKSSWSGLPIIR